MQRLPDLSEGEQAAGAYAISRDGRLIVGFGSDAAGQQAVVWMEGVPTTLEELLLDFGAEAPDGWRLLDIRAMSADARVLVGNATNAEGAPEGFRVVLPSTP
jgi:uncharacterized membrane protein